MEERTSFSDTLAVIAAELVELGKRPVSTRTYQQLDDLKDRLETVLEDFVHCPSCNGMFPADGVAQLTLKGRTATICSNCAITALQRGELDIRFAEEDAPGPEPVPKRNRGTAATAKRKSSRKREPEAEPEPEPQPVEEPDAEVEGPADEEVEVEDEEEDVDESSDAERDSDDELDEDPEEEGPVVPHTASGVAARRGTSQSRTTRLSDDEDGNGTEEDQPKKRRARKLTAKPPASGEEFQATFAQVARHVDRTAREVRQIGRLIEEISPPMDVEKTTRYVQAELKNTRSRIPMDLVGDVVRYLKEGLPEEQ